MSVQKLNRRRGKELERYVAKRFAGKRLGILGGEDVTFKDYSIECKERKSFKTIRNWLAQANAHAGTKTPLVYFHELHTAHNIDIVMMFADDFEELVKDASV